MELTFTDKKPGAFPKWFGAPAKGAMVGDGEAEAEEARQVFVVRSLSRGRVWGDSLGKMALFLAGFSAPSTQHKNSPPLSCAPPLFSITNVILGNH